MRDHNKAFCRLVAETFDCPGPVFEFGSYQVEGQEGYANLRGLFPGKEYVGCDMRPGPGVDRVEDVSGDPAARRLGRHGALHRDVRARLRGPPGVRRGLPHPQAGRRVRHHVAAEFPDPRLSRRLLADDAQLPAADARAVRRAVVGLPGLPGVSPHGDGGGHQGADPGGLSPRGRRRWSRPIGDWLREARSALPAGEKLRRLASRIYRSKGERRQVADYYAADFQVDIGAARQRDRDRESPIHTAA